MAREITQNQKDGLANEEAHATVQIQFASNTPTLYLATAELVIGGQEYEGRIKMTEPLRMSLTKKVDKMSFEIENIDLAIGQDLIASEIDFKNSFAIHGSYHKSDIAGEWHDEKITGEIIASEINGDAILCKFVSDIEAAEYTGKAFNSVFLGLPARPTTPAFQINDLRNFHGELDYFGKGKLGLLYDDIQFGRYYLPEDLSVN